MRQLPKLRLFLGLALVAVLTLGFTVQAAPRETQRTHDRDAYDNVSDEVVAQDARPARGNAVAGADDSRGVTARGRRAVDSRASASSEDANKWWWWRWWYAEDTSDDESDDEDDEDEGDDDDVSPYGFD